MTTTTKRPVSKSRVNTLTRDIRRNADVIRNVVDSLDLVRKQPTYRGEPDDTLEQTLARSPQGRQLIHRFLGEIEGTTALLRELLGVED